MNTLTVQEKQIIEYLFKYIELSKKMLEALCVDKNIKHSIDAIEDEQYIFDQYKSNQFLTYADNYEELINKENKSKIMASESIDVLGITWQYQMEGSYILFENEKMYIAANYININFIDPIHFLRFLKKSLLDEPTQEITESEIQIQFKILEDKLWLTHAEINTAKGWVKTEYMINYSYLLDQAKQ